MRILILILFTFLGLCKSQENSSSDIDDDITLVKKPMIILPTSTHPNESLKKKVISIISEQATTIGRFDVIDRNMVDKILEEQEFQLSGLVKKNDIAKIGEFAAAEIALLLEIIHFGQKGIPMTEDGSEKEEENNTLFKWVVKTVVKETIDNIKARDTLALENNIQTELKAKVTIVNIESGISESSFNLNASYTGGTRDYSLIKMLNQLAEDARIKLKEIYMITSEVIDVEGSYINMFSGKNLGLKKGAMFEIASKNRLKTYKGKRISLPGKTRGLVKITDIGLDGSRAKIVRKWRKIKAGQKAYELKSSPLITDMSFIFLKNHRYEISGKAWINSYSDFTGSVNFHLGSIIDSRKDMDAYLGLGTDLNYHIFSKFGTSGSVSLSLPALLAWRGDDDGHNVLSFFSDPSLDANLAIQINKTRDVVLSVSYVFTSIHGPWQWKRDTGSNDEDGNSITETEWAVWDDGVKPDLKPEGLYLSLSIRKIRF